MAENFRRRFSFRRFSLRKAKTQSTRPKSSIDVVDSRAELKRSSSVQPKSSSRERLHVGASNVVDSRTELSRSSSVQPKSSSRERLGASNVGDSRTELRRSSSVQPKSSSRERLGASNDGIKRSSLQAKTQSVRPRSSIDAVDSRTEIRRSSSVRPESSSRGGASSVRKDATKRFSVQDWNDAWSRPMIGQALEPFTAILRCDLTFEAGDQILILTKTSKQFDWWEGSVRGQTGDVTNYHFLSKLDVHAIFPQLRLGKIATSSLPRK